MSLREFRTEKSGEASFRLDLGRKADGRRGKTLAFERLLKTGRPSRRAGIGSRFDSRPALHAIDLAPQSNRSPKFNEPRPPDRLCGREFWRAKPCPTQLSISAARVSPAGTSSTRPLPFFVPSCLCGRNASLCGCVVKIPTMCHGADAKSRGRSTGLTVAELFLIFLLTADRP